MVFVEESLGGNVLQLSRLLEVENSGSCAVCGRHFGSGWLLRNHMRKHTGEKPYMCSTCGRNFSERGNLKKHLKQVHMKIRGHTCPVCNRSFSQKQHLDTHLYIHTQDNTRAFTCRVCNYTYTSSQMLQFHLRKHLGLSFVKKQRCEKCGRVYSQPAYLKHHIRVCHSNVQIKCPLKDCSFVCKSKKALADHTRRIHEHQKPFMCDICGRHFSGSGNLCNHVRTHENERRFLCSICKRGFHQRGNYLRHPCISRNLLGNLR
ncbi:hypothetical protein AAMO2058_000174400 [Amorphochlora amoebiformis]